MPTYINRCKSCGHTHETTQRITDEDRPVCPACGQPTHRVIQPAGFSWGCGGFYATQKRFADYRD